ncbi:MULTISPECIES: site-specific integrase [unclassified Streptomyces]|uniref:tyrosine-type recombinase/integrase n=1 Tax=unclassified Streptomyces TaxID=2593676 RepID=UPI000DB9C538|nr:site-specific integrase [Streptomyces sp. PsTaAH-137]MYT72448.1 tyrosine-type recombinase/integrase [Streptomyces sp. SID8367]RAJ71016.1 site-specific recombinase XerD [Streptomyces sp. PsTaAH-137]
MKSYKVVIWKLSVNRSAQKPTHLVRWSVEGSPFHDSYKTKPLADRFRAKLLRATERGEAFDTVTGLPDSLRGGKVALSFVELAVKYVDARWAEASAKQRDSVTDALATVLPVPVKTLRGRPDPSALRRALRSHLLPPPRRERERPEEIAAALVWLSKASLPVAELSEGTRAQDLVDALTRRLDGKPAATQTYRRRRAVVFNVLQYAVELGALTVNPLSQVRRTRGKRAVQEVDRRVVVNPRQARELLTALTYVGEYDRASGRRLRAFFGCLYYAAVRPGEALGLRRSDCFLPEKGWGRIELAETRPTAGKAWTDSGEAHDRRGLKQREAGEIRTVPIPPPLVRLLLDHIKEFGTAPDGRLFSSERGNVVAASSYSRVWKQARELALLPHQVGSVMAARPYDLRHAGVSQWLNSGVPAPEVAARAGHSVDVLLRIYAKCVDGQEAEMNDRIMQGLGEGDDET